MLVEASCASAPGIVATKASAKMALIPANSVLRLVVFISDSIIGDKS